MIDGSTEMKKAYPGPSAPIETIDERRPPMPFFGEGDASTGAGAGADVLKFAIAEKSKPWVERVTSSGAQR